MDVVKAAFAERSDIEGRILDHLQRHPEAASLFRDISQHVISLKSSISNPALSLNQAEHQNKKRKLDESAEGSAKWSQVQEYSDISFSIPQRKKLKLGVGLSIGEGIRGKNASDEAEFLTKWSRVKNIFCLPVPEKAQQQYNFCVLLDGTQTGQDQALWTVPATVPKEGSLNPPVDASSTDTYDFHMVNVINKVLAKRKTSVIRPSEAEFASKLVQAHRKAEKAYHVKAFRGAKDGFLFFLANGIFWGFKKPLEFFPFDLIDSVSYTSVLQRTFNLNISSRASPADAPQEFEFSMLDQEDFGGIDEYVKKHQLQDASMAEKRRAKKLNINGAPSANNNGTPPENGEGESELQKAAREAKEQGNDDDDDDEEDDENFDPGSEGESEGEGGTSEEGEDGDEPAGEENDGPL